MQESCRLLSIPEQLSEILSDEGQTEINYKGKTIYIHLCKCKSVNIRTLHIIWITFFLSFFIWFSTSNLSSFIIDDLNLTNQHISFGYGISAFSTMIFRIISGNICDVIGSKKTCLILLLFCSISIIIGIMTVHSYITYYIILILIGMIGASFVITSYHTTQIFASKYIGTALGITTGWGNIGGGFANYFMPLFTKTLIDEFHIKAKYAWRLTIVIPCILLLFMSIIYQLFTTEYGIRMLHNKSTKKHRMYVSFL